VLSGTHRAGTLLPWRATVLYGSRLSLPCGTSAWTLPLLPAWPRWVRRPGASPYLRDAAAHGGRMARQLEGLPDPRQRGPLDFEGPQVVIEVVGHIEIGPIGTERHALRQPAHRDLAHAGDPGAVNGQHGQRARVVVPGRLRGGAAIDEHGHGQLPRGADRQSFRPV